MAVLIGQIENPRRLGGILKTEDLGPDDLKEFVKDTSPASGSMGPYTAQAQVVYDVPYALRVPALRLINGYAWVDSQGVLHRANPIRHPDHPFLVAERVDRWEGIGPRDIEKTVGFGGRRPRMLQTYTTTYDVLRLWVNFHNPAWKPLEDSQLAGDGTEERYRYTYTTSDPAVNTIALEGGEVKFKAPGAAVDGRPFTAKGRTIQEAQSMLCVHWHRVPLDYFMDSNDIPWKLDRALGKVNSKTFKNYQPGTLLMEPYKLGEPHAIPIAFQDGIVRYWCDVEIYLRKFDPPRTSQLAADQLAAGTIPGIGHLLCPSSSDRLYYYVETEGGRALYEGYDLNTLFQPLSKLG